MQPYPALGVQQKLWHEKKLERVNTLLDATLLIKTLGAIYLVLIWDLDYKQTLIQHETKLQMISRYLITAQPKQTYIETQTVSIKENTSRTSSVSAFILITKIFSCFINLVSSLSKMLRIDKRPTMFIRYFLASLIFCPKLKKLEILCWF